MALGGTSCSPRSGGALLWRMRRRGVAVCRGTVSTDVLKRATLSGRVPRRKGL